MRTIAQYIYNYTHWALIRHIIYIHKAQSSGLAVISVGQITRALSKYVSTAMLLSRVRKGRYSEPYCLVDKAYNRCVAVVLPFALTRSWLGHPPPGMCQNNYVNWVAPINRTFARHQHTSTTTWPNTFDTARGDILIGSKENACVVIYRCVLRDGWRMRTALSSGWELRIWAKE